MPDNPLSSVGETLQHKFVGLPVWMWVVIGGAGFWLFTRMGGGSAGSQSYGMVATPTGDQMSSSAINDLNHSLIAEMDERFGEITEAQAASNAGTMQQLSDFMDSQSMWFQGLIDSQNQNQAALVGVLNDQQDDFAAQMALQNGSFIDALNALTQGLPSHATPPPAINGPSVAGIPAWVTERLASPYWQSREYVKRTDLNVGSQYSEAADAFLRPDNPSGTTSGAISQNARAQLAQLIAAGEVYRNPYYPG